MFGLNDKNYAIIVLAQLIVSSSRNSISSLTDRVQHSLLFHAPYHEVDKNPIELLYH